MQRKKPRNWRPLPVIGPQTLTLLSQDCLMYRPDLARKIGGVARCVVLQRLISRQVETQVFHDPVPSTDWQNLGLNHAEIAGALTELRYMGILIDDQTVDFDRLERALSRPESHYVVEPQPAASVTEPAASATLTESEDAL